MTQNHDDYEARREAIEADHDREIEHYRNLLAVDLAAAQAALRSAAHTARILASERVYDVEISEGPGVHAPEVLDHMVITLAGVRATTVEAGR